MTSYTNFVGPYYMARRARGTPGAPTAVQNGDGLAGFYGEGYGTTAFGPAFAGGMTVQAAQNWTDTAQGTALTFTTTPINSTTPATRMTLDASREPRHRHAVRRRRSLEVSNAITGTAIRDNQLQRRSLTPLVLVPASSAGTRTRDGRRADRRSERRQSSSVFRRTRLWHHGVQPGFPRWHVRAGRRELDGLGAGDGHELQHHTLGSTTPADAADHRPVRERRHRYVNPTAVVGSSANGERR